MEKNLDLNLRLTKLEESYFALSSHLDGERVLRKVEDDKCKQICDFLAKQIIDIKEKDSSQLFNKLFSSLKIELLNSIDAKIESKILENKKNLDIQYINNIEKIKGNKSFNNNELLFSPKSEMNKIYKYVEDINHKYDEQILSINHKIDEIYNNNMNIKLENDTLLNKLNDLNISLNHLNEEQQNFINNIHNDIKEEIFIINSNLEKRINNIEKYKNEQVQYNSDNINISSLKSDFDSLSNNYLREIEELKNNLMKENDIKEKEIACFEQHFIEEYENFTKFINEVLNQNINHIKAINEYIASDLEIVKNKNQYLEETLLKLRSDIYDSLEKNIKYVLDKIHLYMDSKSEEKNTQENIIIQENNKVTDESN